MQELSTSLLQLKKKKTQRNLPRKIAPTLNISKYCVLFYTFFWLYYYLNLRFFGMFDLKLRLSQYFILQTLYVKMAFFDERLLFIEVCACIQYLCIHDSSNLTHTHSLSLSNSSLSIFLKDFEVYFYYFLYRMQTREELSTS